MTAILAGGDLEPADQPPANAATLDMAHGPDVRCFRPVVVSRYRRPRSHEHSGRQAKVAASSLHTFTPGGSPLFRLRASGTTRGITPPGPGDGVTIFGNGSNHAPPSRCPDGSRSGASPGADALDVCAGSTPPPPRQGPPEHAPPAPPGARPRGTGAWNDVTAVCQVPSHRNPPQGTPGPLGPQGPPGTGDPRFGTRQGMPGGTKRSQAFTPIARSNISRYHSATRFNAVGPMPGHLLNRLHHGRGVATLTSKLNTRGLAFSDCVEPNGPAPLRAGRGGAGMRKTEIRRLAAGIIVGWLILAGCSTTTTTTGSLTFLHSPVRVSPTGHVSAFSGGSIGRDPGGPWPDPCWRVWHQRVRMDRRGAY